MPNAAKVRATIYDGYRDSRMPDFIGGAPQVWCWNHGLRRTGNAISTVRYWLWWVGGGRLG